MKRISACRLRATLAEIIACHKHWSDTIGGAGARHCPYGYLDDWGRYYLRTPVAPESLTSAWTGWLATSIVVGREKGNSISSSRQILRQRYEPSLHLRAPRLSGKTAETTGKDSRKGPERQETGLSGCVLESFPVKIWTRAKIERSESCKKKQTQSDETAIV